MNLISLKDIIPSTDYPIIHDGRILEIDNDRDVNWVFRFNNSLYRLIINSNIQEERWSKIQEFMNTNEFQELMKQGFIPNYELTDMKLEGYLDGDIYKIIDEVYCLYDDFGDNFKTISQEIDCLRLMCKISILLEEFKSEYVLTDVNWFNFGFDHYKPVYVDVGSFSTKKGDWINDHVQKMINKFGLTFKNNWNILLEDINKINIELDKGPWGDYSNAAHLDYEFNIVFNWLKSKKDIKSIIDVGCCSGEFSHLFSKKKYNVIAIDNSEYVLDKLYNNSKNTKIFCVKMDITKKYNSVLGKEWKRKIASDVVFCSSIIHHLYKSGFDFKKQCELWNKICNKYAIIEYINKTDCCIKDWELDEKYTRNNFLISMAKNWKLIDTKSSEYPNRYWYFFEKRLKNNG